MNFNEKCYKILIEVPKGRVTTYKEIAKALGCSAYRAVGNAMAQNENLVEVPCHRVVNSDGKVGNYRLGVKRKIQLLQEEGINFDRDKIVDFLNIVYKFP